MAVGAVTLLALDLQSLVVLDQLRVFVFIPERSVLGRNCRLASPAIEPVAVGAFVMVQGVSVCTIVTVTHEGTHKPSSALGIAGVVESLVIGNEGTNVASPTLVVSDVVLTLFSGAGGSHSPVSALLVSCPWVFSISFSFSVFVLVATFRLLAALVPAFRLLTALPN